MATVVNMGDEGFFGWLQTLLYFASAWACYLRHAVTRIRKTPRPAARVDVSEGLLWLLLSLACLVLGVNKQLDAQKWLLSAFKEWVLTAGHDWDKQLVRKATVALAVVGVLVVGAITTSIVRRASIGLRCSALGLVLLGPFALVRMARFGRVPGLDEGGGIVDVALELLPTLLVLAGATLIGGRRGPVR